MGISDSKCVQNVIWLNDSTGSQDIYRKRDGKLLFSSVGIWGKDDKWLLDSIVISDSKCDLHITWLQNTTRFQDFYRKKDAK